MDLGIRTDYGKLVTRGTKTSLSTRRNLGATEWESQKASNGQRLTKKTQDRIERGTNLDVSMPSKMPDIGVPHREAHR